MTSREIEDLLRADSNAAASAELIRLIGEGVGVVPFVGAGMSMPFGFPGWRDFLVRSCRGSSIEHRLGKMLDADRYEEAAELLYEHLEQGRFQAALTSSFGDRILDRKSEPDFSWGALEHLPDLAVGPILTTNFDHVLERLFESVGVGLRVLWGTQRLDSAMGALQRRQLFLLKLHGDVADPRERILTLSEYRQAYGGSEPGEIRMQLPLPRLLGNILSSHVLLFLGCSLSADRTMQALRAVAQNYKSLVHFAILERPHEDSRFEERQRQLSALNILGIWYPPGRHDLIGPILARLAEAVQGAGMRTARRQSREEPRHNLLGKGEKSFIGRSDDLAKLADLTEDSRLVTLLGAGGCGKTELATRLGHRLLHRFEDGVWLVELAPVQEEGLIPQTVAAALGLQEQAQRPPTDLLADHLQSRNALLLLDNCEHLIAGCRELLRELLGKCPRLHVLATSRKRLALQAERIHQLGPLSLPDPGRLPHHSQLEQYEAIELFIERVRSRWSEFVITSENSSAIVDICLRLDGLPLAIELVAGRMATRSPQQIADDLASDRLFRLARDRRSERSRQKSLLAAIRWSYDLLDPEQRRLVRRLSVFQGGFDAEAMAAVCALDEEDEFDLLDQLEDLIELSLVGFEGLGQRRFTLLETIRQFGRHRLREEGEEVEVRKRHAQRFLALAEQAKPELLKSRQESWLERLHLERDNLRAALRWSLKAGAERLSLRLAQALWRFWEIRGYYHEGKKRLGEVLEKVDLQSQPSASSEALSGLGMIAYRQGDVVEASRRFEQAYSIQKTLEDDDRLADCLNDLGLVMRLRGRFEEALDYYRRSLDLEEKTGDRRGQAVARFNAGDVLLLMGRIEESQPQLKRSRSLFESDGNLRDSAFPVKALGMGALHRDRYEEAGELLQESLNRFTRANDKRGMGECLCGLAHIDLRRDRIADSGEKLSEAFDLHRSIRNNRGLIRCMELLALLLYRQGDDRCLFFGAAADRARELVEIRRPPLYQAELNDMLQALRLRLQPESYESTRRSGSESSLQTILESWPLAPAAGQPGQAASP